MTMLGHRRPEASRSWQPSDSDALIKEARRRQRRRYLLIVAALSVAAAGAVAIWLEVAGGGRGRQVSPPSQRQPPVAQPAAGRRLREVRLPSSALFDEISLGRQGLLLSGVTLATANSLTQTCAAASVDPRSLSVGRIVTGSCDDPRLSGHAVGVVNTPVPRSNDATLSISRVNPVTGGVALGPVVMTYGSYSDTRPVMAYGTAWLWIYDVESTFGPELLQVSTRSGRVVDRVPMPALSRPLLAADDRGVWIANSIEGSPGPALSYVAAGASAPTTVDPDTGLPICWLAAGGTSAWVGAGAGWYCGKQNVERYVDGARVPVYSTPGRAGFTPFYVIGDDADGLWGMQWSQPVSPGATSPQRVLFIDPKTGIESVAAELPPVVLPNGVPTDGLVQGQAVYFDRALYLLEPPFREGGWLGYTSLVRVPVSTAGQ